MDNEVRSYFYEQVEKDDNIIAAGTDGSGSVVVFVQDDRPEALSAHAVRSGDVKFVKTLPFQAYDYRTEKHRPARPGVSCGSHRITAGTIGLWVRDKLNGKKLLLSNNHILADTDSGHIGDDILQPGKADGGVVVSDTIANLTRWVPLRTSITRWVDAAVAEVINPDDVDLDIVDIGYCNGVEDTYENQWIHKSGRTSGYSRGTVYINDAKVRVDYGPAGTISLEDCVITYTFSQPGDSGSGFFGYATNRFLGLLFAGNGQYTIFCKSKHIMDLLDIEIIEPPIVSRTMICDISKWQGQIDFSKLSKKARGVFIKVCQAADSVDVRFVENYDGAVAHGMLKSGYIYVDPSVSAQAHFNNFVSVVGDRKFDFPPAIDIEQSSGQTPQVVTAVVQQLAALLEGWYGSKPFIYTNTAIGNNYLLPWSGWGLHPLWLAYWPNWNTGNLFIPIVPNGWKDASGNALPGKPELWQIGPHDAGSEFGVDSVQIDVNTTSASFEYLLDGTSPPPDVVHLVTSVVGSGVVFPASGSWPSGTSVMLTATPEVGWKFLHWEGSIIGSDNPISVVMNSDKNITAVFVEEDDTELATEEHNLGITTISGLRIRSDAGTSYSIVGTLPFAQEVEILEKKKDKLGNDWVRIGYKQWSAQYYKEANGWKEYIRYVLNKFL